jgi:hypothetical protein
VKIHVSLEDIDTGVRESETECAVARGCKRAFGTDNVQVGGLWITVNGHHYDIPRDVEEFIEQFDDEAVERADLDPFEFDLPDPPAPVILPGTVGHVSIDVEMSL